MKYDPNIVLAYWRECGLPQAEPEHRFAAHIGRKMRFDFAFVAARVYVEADGGIWVAGGHNRGAQMLKDWEKRNLATVLGWRGLWCQPKDLCTEQFTMAIKAALAESKEAKQ